MEETLEFNGTRFVGALRVPPRSLQLPRKGCIFLIGIVLQKHSLCHRFFQIFPALVWTILCKFGQICATGNAFVRLFVGRNSILNFPANIWTGMCRALLCGDDSSHSQSQSGKRLLLASRGHPIRSPLYHGSCIDPTHQSYTLDLTSEAPILRLLAIQL